MFIDIDITKNALYPKVKFYGKNDARKSVFFLRYFLRNCLVLYLHHTLRKCVLELTAKPGHVEESLLC